MFVSLITLCICQTFAYAANVQGETTIEPSRFARNLGVAFNEHLSMEQHVSTTARWAFYLLQCVFKARKFADNATCNALVCSLVFPHLDYCNSLLAGATLSVLTRVQNATARLVIRIPRMNPSEPLRRSLHWPPNPRTDRLQDSYPYIQSFDRHGAWVSEGTSGASSTQANGTGLFAGRQSHRVCIIDATEQVHSIDS